MQFGQHNVANESLRQHRVFTQREGYVLVDTDVGQERTILKQHANTLAHLVEFGAAHFCDILAIEKNTAAVRQDLTAHQPQKRRFSGSAGPHDRRHATSWNLQIQAIEYFPLTSRIVQVADNHDVLFGVPCGSLRLTRGTVRHLFFLYCHAGPPRVVGCLPCTWTADASTNPDLPARGPDRSPPSTRYQPGLFPQCKKD